MVVFIVAMSVALSLWLFWRSLYLPELKNHASHIASQLHLMDTTDETTLSHWLSHQAPITVVVDPEQFPEVTDKVIAEFFTDVLEQEVSSKLGHKVHFYFEFKPTPTLWIQDSRYNNRWLQEPMPHYSQYSPLLFAWFVFGLPLMTLIIIVLLVRALNRPLKHLEKVAGDYILTGVATQLPTNKGSNEIRKVNTAFNQLFDGLYATQKERTIMLAGISHDLRTPLTRMRLTAEMLPDEFFKEGLIYDIEDMDAILEQFISFMKDGSDEPAQATDLNAICQEIMVQFSGVNFLYQNELRGTILLRPLSIKRMIINLVNNAIRYGDEPIHLICKIISDNPLANQLLISDNQSTKTLLICVKDEGVGVDDSQLERIMQPFERGETARTTQGSGLGLAIVSRIAKLHNGALSVINHPDGGLQACVHIPLD